MWNCPKCATRNWEDALVCHKCKSDRSGQLRFDRLVLLKRPENCGFYSVTLAPGVLRYLKADAFVAIQVEDWIGFFKPLSRRPEIEGLWGGNRDGLDFVNTAELFDDIA